MILDFFVRRLDRSAWRDRGAAYGIAGLDDEPRSGRSKVVDDSAIIAPTLEPDKLGVTHWFSRLLDKHLGHFEVLRVHHPPSDPPRLI